MDQDTKTCPRCGEAKPWNQFYVDRRRNSPGSYCRSCMAEYRAARYVPNPPQHAEVCKQCGEPIPQTRSSRARVWCGKRCRATWTNSQQTREYRRDSMLRSTYGIGLAEYEALLLTQHGKCRICGEAEGRARNGVFDVDHDHKTGQVRGLLCHRCNWALGILGDDPTLLRKAADYLEGKVPEWQSEPTSC